ncbi:uncharacterized protein LOC117652050 [Thrips palmi]|uniref:Uncharacterized protein LOC117652050 n=1 Tax=Thrips palmi TaxID=161013 RepID=A0A6P9A4Y6_THRPL|nr:uncharacterized protein LOC117652050 [Thrips palmi]
MAGADDLRSPARKKMKAPPPQWEAKNSIRVTGLPSPLMERSVIAFFERLRIRNKIEPGLKTSIVKCIDFPREDYIFIEFSNADIAHRVASLKGVTYNRNAIEMESPLHLDETVINETMAISFNAKSIIASTPVRMVSNAKRRIPLMKDSNNNKDPDAPVQEDDAAEQLLNLSIDEAGAGQDTDASVQEDHATEQLLHLSTNEAGAGNTNEVVETTVNESFTDYSLMVTVTGLPETFVEDALEMVLQAYLIKNGSIKEKGKIFSKVIKSNPVVIQFVNEAIAKAACELKKIHFLADEVELKAAEPPQKKIVKVIASGFTSTDTSMEMMLDRTLKAHLIKNSTINEGDEIIKMVHYGDDKTSLIIEFLDDQVAKAASHLKSFFFMADEISLKLDEPPRAHEVFAFNVTTMDEGLFKMIIDAYATKHGIVRKPNEEIIKKIHPKVGSSIKLEVANEYFSSFLCNTVRTVNYLADVVELKQDESQLDASFGVHGTVECMQDSSISTRPSTSLDGDWATQCFLQECCHYKMNDKSRGKFLGTSTAFASIVETMKEKYNIQVDTTDCKKRKKSLDEQHRRGPHDTWGPYMSFLRNESTDCPELFDIPHKNPSLPW